MCLCANPPAPKVPGGGSLAADSTHGTNRQSGIASAGVCSDPGHSNDEGIHHRCYEGS